MRKKIILGSILSIGLCGCANNHEYCRNLGLVFGTNEYAYCVMKKDQEHTVRLQQALHSLNNNMQKTYQYPAIQQNNYYNVKVGRSNVFDLNR